MGEGTGTITIGGKVQADATDTQWTAVAELAAELAARDRQPAAAYDETTREALPDA